MSSTWIIQLSTLMVLQIVTSFVLIYKKKKRISYFTEILLSLISIGYAYFIVPILIEKSSFEIISKMYQNYSFTKDKILWYIVEYAIMKILLLAIIWLTKYFSFYALVSSTKKNGRIAKIGSMLFGKKRFLRFASTMWNKVDYGIRIKKGLPGMVNKKHQSTGIYFDKDGFPKFKAIAKVKLSRKFYHKSRETHFYQCNKIISERIQHDKRFASKFTKAEIQSFKNGDTPSKYTWHHHQDKGVLQLVDSKIHANVSHRGGFSIWGKREK